MSLFLTQNINNKPTELKAVGNRQTLTVRSTIPELGVSTMICSSGPVRVFHSAVGSEGEPEPAGAAADPGL